MVIGASWFFCDGGLDTTVLYSFCFIIYIIYNPFSKSKKKKGKKERESTLKSSLIEELFRGLKESYP